ncbi:hypothetical protein BKA70DRAFT_831018 [Coprinopsis sp. MPI-PUGE-AT-0042]|nr:hypothetical protein BKA70DRAFT_831018 [Coprinopsis sp. MPI-PUGE-AT-0042]
MHNPRPKSINRPARLDPYLSINDILPHSGLPTLHGHLSQLNDNIKALEDEITKLQAILDAKKEELGWLHHERTVCNNIKHPIRSVPPEVLGQIFAFALDSPSPNRFVDVARLRAVCSPWRQVALTTPGLLTSLTIDIRKWCKARVQGEDAINEGLRLG